jgi:predicted transcriptional regulator
MFYMSNMLGVRLDRETDRLLTQLARQRKTTKSALVREAIQRYVAVAALARSAREQSIRASSAEEPDLEHDDRGWTR